MIKFTTLMPAALAVGLFMPAVSFAGQAESVAAADSAANVLDEVVVTGSNQSVQRNLLPYAVSVVGQQQLDATGSTQVLSAISGMVPSLFVTQRSIFGFGVSNGGSGHIKMRGVGGDRASGVLMMVDGQPQFAGIYSHHIADFYDKEYVERVEVLRGPGSVLYGSNAMAGTINVITKNAAADGVRTTLSTQYGSYNTWLSSATNTVRYGRFTSLVSGSYSRTDGNIDGMDYKQADGYAKVGYELSDRWKLAADYTIMNFRGNDPVYPRLDNPESTDVYRQNVTRGEASLSVANSYDATNGVARVYYSYGNHYIDDPRHFHSTDDRLGVLLYQNFQPWRGAGATVGFDFDTYRGRVPVSGGNAHKPGSMSTMSSKSVTEYSPYVTLQQHFLGDLLTVNGGLRMANSDKFGTRWVPQAGFAVNPGYGWTFKGTFAVGYRNPSFREMYLYRMANPDLDPERMNNYEVTVAKAFGHWLSADLTLYYSKGDNLIQVLDMKNQNTGRFINKGIELSLHSQPLTNLWLTATYSYLHTSLSNLTGAPRNQYYLGAEWRPVKALSLSADLKGVGGLFVHQTIKHQNYALVNLKAAYDVCRYLNLFVRLENITYARYVINRGYDMPGFTALGGVKLSF